MAKEATSLKRIWTRLIDHVLSSQKMYLDYTKQQLEWLTSTLCSMFLDEEKSVSPENAYKCLVYLNRNIKWGRYCIIFNQNVYEATIKQDTERIYELCNEPTFVELDVLNLHERNKWEAEISIQTLVLNLYTDREILSANVGVKFSNKLSSCFEEVMSFKTSNFVRYVSCHNTHVVFISEMHDNKMVISPTREIDLLYLVLSGGNNPYTGRPLPEDLVLL